MERIRSTCYLQVTYTPIIETMQGQVLTPFWKEPLIEKSLVSESLMASLFYDKYQMFLPYYRQEHDPERFGFPISRQLMSSWEIRICESLFMPLYYYLRDLMRGFEYQHCDETTWMTVCDGRKPGAKGYFWVHLSGELLDGFRVAFISFELTRSASHLTDFFDGIDHPVHLTDDAYAGYYTAQKQFPDYLTICGCLTHARRRYVNAMLTLRLPSDITREELEELPEYACIIKISKIYSEDEKLKPLPAEKRLKVRQETVKPLFNDFIDYVKAIDMTDPYVSDTFRDAVEYTLGHEEDLSQFLNDGNVPIDNGACERLIRDLARLRVNSLFSKSVRGAKTSAVIITLMQTAELNGADPYYYMKYIMEGLPQHLYEDPSGYVSDMMPWTDRYRAYEQDEKQKVMDSFKPPDGTGKPKLRKRPYIRQSTKGCGLSA